MILIEQRKKCTHTSKHKTEEDQEQDHPERDPEEDLKDQGQELEHQDTDQNQDHPEPETDLQREPEENTGIMMTMTTITDMKTDTTRNTIISHTNVTNHTHQIMISVTPTGTRGPAKPTRTQAPLKRQLIKPLLIPC